MGGIQKILAMMCVVGLPTTMLIEFALAKELSSSGILRQIREGAPQTELTVFERNRAERGREVRLVR